MVLYFRYDVACGVCSLPNKSESTIYVKSHVCVRMSYCVIMLYCVLCDIVCYYVCVDVILLCVHVILCVVTYCYVYLHVTYCVVMCVVFISLITYPFHLFLSNHYFITIYHFPFTVSISPF